jgi:hypothetical protein
MDFLDPKKHRAHMIRLIVGYVLIGLAILIATTILLYRAYGFGIDKDGEVVQSGLVFVSSQPGSADILVDGQKYKDNTNTRIQLPEGTYNIDVKRSGYRDWNRTIDVEGGSVSRYDYPLLIPQTLTPASVKTYASAPGFSTQSPDRQWALVQTPGTAETVGTFDVYDLSDPEAVAESLASISLPARVLTGLGAGDHTWKLTEWSTDNRHVVLEHTYADGSEYILLDREQPELSQNLTRTLGLKIGQVLSLRDKKFNAYYVFDPAAKTVASASIAEATTLTPVLTNVLAFKSYGDDILLYVTETDAPAGQVMTMLRDDDVTYKIREIGVGGPYLLDLARYDDSWYVAVGASVDNKVYVFKNPQNVRKAAKVKNLSPVQILRVTAPNYMAFSSNTRFIMIENGTSFGVYDAETDKSYTYATSLPLDPGVAHATWMDGHRLTYVSGGKTVVFDYDNINFQTLTPAAPGSLPFFDRDYRYLYNMAPPQAEGGQAALTSTSLSTEQDR